MSWFIARVELHNARAEDYEALHTYMELEGFSRVVKGSDGRSYHLPPAEYFREANLEITAVRAAAERAASRVKPSYAVFVAQVSNMCWSGLPTVAYTR